MCARRNRRRRLLIYDGGCGICVRLARAAARFDSGRRVRFAAFQELPDRELTELGISRDACARRLRFRDRKGRWHGGAFAVNRFLLAAAPRGLRGLPVRALVVLAFLFPPLLLAELLGYEIVARSRRRCAVSEPAGAPGTR